MINQTAATLARWMFLFCGLVVQAIAQVPAPNQLPMQAGHTHDIIRVGWSPDDQRIVSYSAGDGSIRLWDVTTARLLWSARTGFIQRRDEYYTLTDFIWSPDQRLIASGSANGSIQVWETETGKLSWNVRAHADKTSVVAFDPQGKYLASSGQDAKEQAEIKLWEVTSGKLIVRTLPASGIVVGFAFSNDGATLQAGTADGELTTWNVAEAKLVSRQKAKLCGDTGRSAHRVAYSSKLNWVAARCFDQFVLTETATGHVLRTFATGFDHNATVIFSGDDHIAATRMTGGIHLVPLNNASIRQVDTFHLGSTIALNTTGTLLAEGGGWGDAAIKITEVATGKTYRLLEGHPGLIRALVFSPDGTRLASGSGDRIIRLWEPGNLKVLATLAGHERSINALAFHPRGAQLVSAGQDQTLRVWDAKSGAPLQTLDVSDDGLWGVEALAFSPDGKILVTAGDNGAIKLWRTDTWKIARRLQANDGNGTNKALSVAFSPDGAQILTGNEYGTARLWNLRTGQLVRTIRSQVPQARAIFTPDGQRIVCAYDNDSPVRVFDARTGRQIRTIGELDELIYVESIAVNPDGKTAAAAESGGGISLFDLRDGKLIAKSNSGVSGSDVLTFSPDGKLLVSGGRNQNLMVWEAHSGRLLRALLPLPSAQELKEREEKARLFAEWKAEREEMLRQANAEIKTWEGKVRISFEYYGEPTNPMDARLMESAQPHQRSANQPPRVASGVWLRLRNESTLPITFRTDSMYLSQNRDCGYTGESGKRYAGLCDETGVSIQYSLTDANGQPIPWGADFGAVSMLPPGASVLFSVRREHLEQGRAIHIRYDYQREGEKRTLEEYGTEQRVRFSASDLPPQ